MSKALFAIAGTTFREIIRQPSIILLITAFFILTLILPPLCLFALGKERYLLFSLGVSTFEIGGLLLAILGALKAISAEIENKTILMLFAKPVSKAKLVFGKFLGVSFIIAIFEVLIVLALFIAIYWWHSTPAGGRGTALYNQGFWAVFSVEMPYILEAAYLYFWQNMILLAALITGSAFLPIAGNALFGIAVFFVGHLNEWLSLQLSGSHFFTIVLKLLPAFQIFDITPLYFEQVKVPVEILLAGTLSGLIYTLLFLVPCVWLLARRDYS